MQEIRRLIDKLARNQAPVFVSGESGTGRAGRARSSRSPRADKPFVAVNCGAIPQELMESEFFGHIKGSFTGAVRDKPGLFQSADGGTLFRRGRRPAGVDAGQAVARDPGKVRAPGRRGQRRTRGYPVSSAPVTATWRRWSPVASFARTCSIESTSSKLLMAPLRARREDIPVMIDHVLARLAQQHRRHQATTRTQRAGRHCTSTTSPATCVNSRTSSNVPPRCATTTSSSSEDLGSPRRHAAAPHRQRKVSPHRGWKTISPRWNVRPSCRHWRPRAGTHRRRKALNISFRALRYRMEKLDWMPAMVTVMPVVNSLLFCFPSPLPSPRTRGEGTRTGVELFPP